MRNTELQAVMCEKEACMSHVQLGVQLTHNASGLRLVIKAYAFRADLPASQLANYRNNFKLCHCLLNLVIYQRKHTLSTPQKPYSLHLKSLKIKTFPIFKLLEKHLCNTWEN